MNASKYVREMVLVPKATAQQGGQLTQTSPPVDTVMMQQQQMPPLYWQGQMLLDQLNTAPVLEQAIRLLQDMKQNIGQPTH